MANNNRELIKQQEKNIKMPILMNKAHRGSYRQKQIEFLQTCTAVYNIVNLSLSSKCNWESYFEIIWKVKKNQILLLLDSYHVLQPLKHLNPIPHTIKLCAKLKEIAQFNQKQLCCLWNLTLEKTKSNEQLINKFRMKYHWNMFLSSHPNLNFDDDVISDVETISSPNLRSRFRNRTQNKMNHPNSCYSDNLNECEDVSDHNILSLIGKEEFQTVKEEWNQCQNALNHIYSKGYHIESFIDNQWFSPIEWKLSRITDDNDSIECKEQNHLVGDDEPFRNLVMVAGLCLEHCK
ncbi:hypothetical protein HDV02_001410 [Globomyces sp. JEL0801]|nr:hypothetical protein HDV02_001410 [Globomyces sp. JEL0801]